MGAKKNLYGRFVPYRMVAAQQKKIQAFKGCGRYCF